MRNAHLRIQLIFLIYCAMSYASRDVLVSDGLRSPDWRADRCWIIAPHRHLELNAGLAPDWFAYYTVETAIASRAESSSNIRFYCIVYLCKPVTCGGKANKTQRTHVQVIEQNQIAQPTRESNTNRTYIYVKTPTTICQSLKTFAHPYGSRFI